MASTCFLIVLLAVSLARWVLGYVSCGCFGVFKLPKWATPLINVVGLGSLAACFPGWEAISTSLHRMSIAIGLLHDSETSPADFARRRASLLGAVSGLSLSCVIIGVVLVPDARNVLLPRLFGDQPIIASPVRFGTMTINKEHVGRMRLENRSSVPARIIGSSRSCTCVSTFDDSAEIPAHGTLEIQIKARPMKAGFFHQRVVICVDHPQQSRCVTDILGNLI